MTGERGPKGDSVSPADACRAAPAAPTITVNGMPRTIVRGATVGDVVAELGWEGRPLAVEVNEQVVPRADFGKRAVGHGDRLEIVTLVGGG